MKKAIMIIALFLSMSLPAVALGPSLGMQLEVRAGGYMTVSPEEARNMFGNGFLIGGSLRKAVFPMLKVGLSIDRISLSDNEAVQFEDLSGELQDEITAAAEDLDIEFSTTPVCLEIMLDPPLLPLYGHAGYGLYKSKVTVREEGSGTLLYDESKSRWGGFLGAGVKMGLPMLPLSFRVGAKYHMLKVDDSTMEKGIKAISVDAGVRLNF
ncbi:MAG TPA: outer membrane beta-barrel protein [Candidatus Mcinerneyibacteriales bacterium]|jgi:hypothetical protein|nr:outer membrane beta-barrel protein [Candidatus Mcinerneyibacteriales bacterium]HPE20598.1 outer membrane beta-barrel protein [Candidatus Mcinerneyibacteriales bacterium]